MLSLCVLSYCLPLNTIYHYQYHFIILFSDSFRHAGVWGSGWNHRQIRSTNGRLRPRPARPQIFSRMWWWRQKGSNICVYMCTIHIFLPIMWWECLYFFPTIISCGFCDLQKMEEALVKSKKEKPAFIPYYVSACRELPGKFLLGYQPRGKPRSVWTHYPGGERLLDYYMSDNCKREILLISVRWVSWLV